MGGEKSWQQLALESQRHRDQTLMSSDNPLPTIDYLRLPLDVTGEPRKHLTNEEVDITERPLRALIGALQTAELTATATVKAFLRRAAIAQRLTNCVLEAAPDEALARAAELDEHLARTGHPIGPLHGLPVSIKSHIGWKGKWKSQGFLAPLSEKYDEDATVVRILRELGAIPFVRTTEPQGVMTLECSSNVHGTTLNPYNVALTSGGSSGGEGALLALRGSPLGIGADVGGSLRAPATNCGIYTLKPTTGRVPIVGLSHFMAGNEAILPTPGVMAADIDGIDLFMKHVIAKQTWESEPNLVPVPWREHDRPFGDTINVGVMWDDGFVKPSKSMTRALREVVSKLEANPRFKVSRWEPYKTAEGIKLLDKLYASDGGEAITKWLAKSGEPMLDLVSYRCKTGPNVKALSINELWDCTVEREVFRYEYLREWNTKAPDMHVILCPPHHGPAQELGTTRYWGYTCIWNLLDYPAAIFPVTRVDPALDREDDGYEPRNDYDAWTHQHYDAEKQKGAPLGLQLVGRRMEDEKVLLAMREICEAAGLIQR